MTNFEMTNKEAVRMIERFLMPTIADLAKSKGNKSFAGALDEAWKVVRKAALEAENRPSDERSTMAWVNMPEAEEKSVADLFRDMDKLKDDFFTEITRLKGNLCQVERQFDTYVKNGDISLNTLNHKTTQNETEIEMLWNETERLKSKMPKEWV